MNRAIHKHTPYDTCVNTELKDVILSLYTGVYMYIILDRYFYDIDILPQLEKFRDWESVNRERKQRIIMISSDSYEPSYELIENFCVKDEKFHNNLINTIKQKN